MEKTASQIRQEMLTRFPELQKEGAPLTAKGRDKIKPKNFALPKKEKYPIHDRSHARNALARASQHASPSTESKIRQKVYSKYPGLKARAKEACLKLADAADSAVKHPYAHTILPSEAAMLGTNLLLGPGTGIIGGLPADVLTTHQLAEGLGRERAKAGIEKEPESFALKHPQVTGIGSRVAGHLLGGGAGYLAGSGIGKAVGGGSSMDIGGYRVGGGEVGGVLGALLGARVGDISGRALGTRAMLKAQEREMAKAPKKPAAEKKEASLDRTADNLVAALAAGAAMAERDLMGIRKEAMDIAARMMAGPAMGKTASAAPQGLRPIRALVQEETQRSVMAIQKLAGLNKKALSLDDIRRFATEDVPGAVGGAAGRVGEFFGQDVPEAARGAAGAVGRFATEDVPEAARQAGGAMGRFATEDVPKALRQAGGAAGRFATEDVPEAARQAGGAIGGGAQDMNRALMEAIRKNPEIAAALTGAAGGAGVGALAGRKGHRGKGALTGAAIGGLGGLAAGHVPGHMGLELDTSRLS